jgi:hypothetical protein
VYSSARAVEGDSNEACSSAPGGTTHIGIAVISAVLVWTCLSSATGNPGGPSDSDAEKLAAQGPLPPAPDPGKYGSDTYYSSDEEEADLNKVAALADSVGALGSARTGVDSMLVRVPLGTTVPKDTTVGTFTVHFEPSRFTAEGLAALNREVGAASEAAAAAGETIALGFGYDADEDLIVIHGTVPKSVADLAIRRSGLSVAADASAGDGRRATSSGHSVSVRSPDR